MCEFPPHSCLIRYISRLNQLYRNEPALHELDFDSAGFEWIDFSDTDSSIISFIRRGRDPGEHIVCVFNCTPVLREGYRFGVPEHGFYREILNSDSELYWGGNMGNLGGVHSEPISWHNKPNSIAIAVPPLGALFFKRDR